MSRLPLALLTLLPLLAVELLAAEAAVGRQLLPQQRLLALVKPDGKCAGLERAPNPTAGPAAAGPAGP